jgi:hypothetical protein
LITFASKPRIDPSKDRQQKPASCDHRKNNNTTAVMAGPPPQNLSLQERVLRLAQTLQFAWFVGHVTLLFSALRYGLSYIFFNYYSKMARFSYRLAFLSAGVTYGIVVYKGYRARTKQGKSTGAFALLGDENVQYLRKSFCKLSF